jgi:glycosyltransferase involved in cell wall biosynthesis
VPQRRSDRGRPGRRPGLLCISQSFWPATTPTAIRASKLLGKLSAQWDITVLTETPSPAAQSPPSAGQMRVEVARGWRPRRVLAALGRLRLGKLLEMIVWPDDSVFWVGPAILAGRRLIAETAPSAIVVFMMPYSAGLAGIALSRLTRLPLILNLDDSPTCTDMHPHFPTRLHYRVARALEDLYARCADAVVYVSATNLEDVRARQPEDNRQRFHLVRYGAEPTDFRPQPTRAQDFEIVYVGAMAGWWTLIEQSNQPGRLRRIYGAWTRLGRYTLTTLDQRTASPAIIGQAIRDALAAHPDWAGRIKLTIYDNTYPASLVRRALAAAGVEKVVTVAEPVPHDEVAEILARADLLFLTLPRRLDGSRGGRISAKTYEYLMTDRPILAALSPGENRDYLSDKPGVFLVEPDDQQRMTDVIAELADAKFAAQPRAYDRSYLHEQLSYEALAVQFASVIRAGIDSRLREVSGGQAPIMTESG